VEDQENNSVEIEVPTETTEETVYETEGLSKEELAMVEKHGLIPKVEETDEHKEQPEVKPEEDSTKEKAEEDEEVLDPSSFEEMDEVFDKDEEKFHKKFTPNAKALYFQNKKNKNLRQELQKEVETFRAEKELNSIKDSVSAKKLAKINELLANPENLTIEALQEVLGSKVQDTNSDTISRQDFEREVAEKKAIEEANNKAYADRIKLAEQIGRSKYDNFEQIATLAQEVINADKTGLKKKLLSEVFTNKDIDEAEIVNAVIEVAQFSQKFKDVINHASSSDKENVNRAIKNSKKQVSSASISSSSNRKVINHDDLTIADIANMTTAQYMKIPKNVRERVLSER
jgi:hypothetical protein